MHLPRELLALALVAALAACSRGPVVEIANNDVAGLVAAIEQANATPGPVTIRLARRGLYVPTREAEAGLLLPAVRDGLVIDGNFAEIRGYSDAPAALLQVEEGARVRIANLVLAEGTDGAVRNYGRLALENVAIVDSSVHTATSIVLNHGRLEATGGEIAYNLLLANGRDCGTVLNFGEMAFVATRVHDNRAVGRYPTVAAAGGILNFGQVRGEGLEVVDNALPEDDDLPGLSFGGILNLGNGRFEGRATADSVREGRQLGVLAGL